MKTPKLKHLALTRLMAAQALGVLASAQAAEPESESFKKYGQVFKGKIGRVPGLLSHLLVTGIRLHIMPYPFSSCNQTRNVDGRDLKTNG